MPRQPIFLSFGAKKCFHNVGVGVKLTPVFMLQINVNYLHNSRAGAKCFARVLIPLGDLLHSGTLTERSGIQNCPNSMSWTLNGLVS